MNGSLNRISPGNKALVHIRPSSSLPASFDDIERIAKVLLIDGEEQNSRMNKGCWVNVDSAKRVVVKAHATMERNRRGDLLVECTNVLAIHDQRDDCYLPVNADDEYNEYITTNENGGSLSSSNQINVKSERHKIFAHWLVDTFGKKTLSQGTGVIDVAGGNGMISKTLTETGIRSTLLDPNPRCKQDKDTKGNGSTQETFGVIPHPLNGGGEDLTSREDNIGHIIKNCSLLCGLHPDQATEPIVELALRLNVPFAIA